MVAKSLYSIIHHIRFMYNKIPLKSPRTFQHTDRRNLHVQQNIIAASYGKQFVNISSVLSGREIITQQQPEAGLLFDLFLWCSARRMFSPLSPISMNLFRHIKPGLNKCLCTRKWMSTRDHDHVIKHGAAISSENDAFLLCHYIFVHLGVLVIKKSEY
jgi:hypothetical protein